MWRLIFLQLIRHTAVVEGRIYFVIFSWWSGRIGTAPAHALSNLKKENTDRIIADNMIDKIQDKSQNLTKQIYLYMNTDLNMKPKKYF